MGDAGKKLRIEVKKVAVTFEKKVRLEIIKGLLEVEKNSPSMGAMVPKSRIDCIIDDADKLFDYVLHGCDIALEGEK